MKMPIAILAFHLLHISELVAAVQLPFSDYVVNKDGRANWVQLQVIHPHKELKCPLQYCNFANDR